MKPSIITRVIIVIFLFVFVLGSNFICFDTVSGETSRNGAWVDSINFEVSQFKDSIQLIKDGLIDLHAEGISADNYSSIEYDPSMDISGSVGFSYELTLNPAEFEDPERLNPFAKMEIREALNYLIDRNYLNELLFDGLGEPAYFSIKRKFPDYFRYLDKVTELEAKYAYDPSVAEGIISVNMEASGATKINNIWHYNDQPITIIFIIRNDGDGKRIPLGDYVADQLESIGFRTDRLYLSVSEASSYWLNSNPADGTWNIYTGAWNHGFIDRDEGWKPEFFNSYSSVYGWSPLWQNYHPSEEFQTIMEDLANHNYSSMEERENLFTQALEFELEFAVRIWLLDGLNITPRRSTITLASDMVGGYFSPLWPLTIRHREIEGGEINVGVSSIFDRSWNPVASNTIGADLNSRFATIDKALLQDPKTGLYHPQRVESAEIHVETGTPMQKTLDWVDLYFEDVIEIPDDAWVDWDAENQEFITAAEIDPLRSDRAVILKSVVTYPTDMFETVKWHDGSPISVADFVMAMIMKFDRTKIESPIYDVQAVLDTNLRAIRIVSTNPLVIETYLDSYQIDAEVNVRDWWPEGDSGQMPWHTTALAVIAESQDMLAFSQDKAASLDVPMTNYLAGETLTIMSTILEPLGAGDKPYLSTMADFLDDTETLLRWNNLRNWYATYRHFWVGTGPFYIDEYDWEGKTLTLTRFPDFPDPSDKWDFLAEGSVRMLAVDYTEGSPGSTFTIIGQDYPPNSEATIFVNYAVIGTTMTDAEGDLKFTLTFPEGTAPGEMLVTVSVNPTHSIWLNIDSEYYLREGINVPIDNVINPFYIFLPLTTK